MAAESKLESKLVKGVERLGGICVKMKPQSRDGWPDRQAFFPNRLSYFIEMKAPGKTPDKLQEIVIEDLRQLGQAVWVIDCEELINIFLKRVSYEMECMALSKDSGTAHNG